MSLEAVPTEKLIKGIKNAFENAESFIKEINILKEYEAWPHAYTLCQFAIEELAKIPMLFQLWIDRINETSIDYNRLDSDFKNHTAKNRLSVETEMSFFKLYKINTGAEWVDSALTKSEELLNNLKYTNELKNESLYVTVNNNDFQSPSDVITEEMFDSIYSTTLLRKMTYKFFINTEKNINQIANMLKEKKED
ncbi:AbiV family abortive infection protein [bacterium]|nr:AbiV family abortive infection protein [bacterium]